VVTTFPWLSVLWLLPLVGAVVIILVPASGRQFAKWLGVAVSVAVLLLSIALAVEFKAGGPTYQFVESHPWIPAFGAGYTLGIDGIALVLVLLTTILVPFLLVAGWNDGGERSRGTQAYVALTLTIESMVLISVISLDVLLFYVFFEAMLIPMYFLIGGFGGGAHRSRAAVKFLLYNLFGGLIMLAAVIGLYVVTARIGHIRLPSDRRRRHLGFAGRIFGCNQGTFPGIHVRLRDQGAAVAVPPLAARRRGGIDTGDRGSDHRGNGQGRHVRHAAVLPAVVP
jgi:NADH-quinone oxidoreductase subunit M